MLITVAVGRSKSLASKRHATELRLVVNTAVLLTSYMLSKTDKRVVLFTISNMRTTVNITIQSIYVKRNTEARSPNHCCRGKAISITYWSARAWVCACVRACVCDQARGCVHTRVALFIQHATRVPPCCDVIYGPSGFTKFFDITSQTARFSRKKYWT